MILEIIYGLAPTVTAGGVGAFLTHKAKQLKVVIRKGIEPHTFQAKTWRADFQIIRSRYCVTCNLPKRAWIHESEPDTPDFSSELRSKIFALEAKDIEWRFANDPEWVKVFGEEYDPKTFQPIPQFHNGECGGALDSCPRCNWEADQRERQEQKLRYEIEAEGYIRKEKDSEANKKRVAEEAEEYAKILWTLWNTVHDKAQAKEEWSDLLDEIGMLKDDALRRKVKDLQVFKRLNYLMYDHEDRKWNRREEVWQAKLERDRDRDKHRYDYY